MVNTEENSRALRQQGFVHLGEVLAPDTTRELRRRLDTFAAQTVVASEYGLICHNPWRGVEMARDIIENVLAPLVLELVDVGQIVLFQDILIAKPPGTRHAVQWHQDFSYWPLDSARGVTLWIALDDADRENGCLRYIPGTHALGEKHPADFFIGATQPQRPHLQRLDAAERESEAVDAPARAGQALAHDPLVWHMSPANGSARPRHAWSLTWIEPAVRWAPEHAPHPFDYQLRPHTGDLVQGEMFLQFARQA